MRLRTLLGAALSLALAKDCLAATYNTEAQSSIPREGLQAEMKGEWEKAISIYTGLLLKQPDNLELWLRVAQIKHHVKNYILAINAYKHAIRIQPDNPALHKALSEIYAEINQPAQALAAVNEAVRLSPDNAEYLLARAKLANWNKKPAIALESYQKILALGKAGQVSVNTVDILVEIGRLQAQLENHQEAIKTYSQAIFLSPDDPKLYLELSRSYANQKELHKALDATNKALELDEDNIELLRIKARLASLLQENQIAVETYQKILDLSVIDDKVIITDRLAILKQIANLQNQARDYNEAIKTYDQAIQIYPNEATLYHSLSQTYVASGNPQKAIQTIDRAIKLDSDNVNYLEAKATLAMWLKDSQLAIETKQKILALSQDNDKKVTLLREIASLYNQDHQYLEAIKAYEQAIILKPNRAELYQELSQTYAASQDPQNALKAISKAIEIAPDHISYLEAKAKYANWLNDRKLARTTYKKILSLSPKHKEAIAGLKWLEYGVATTDQPPREMDPVDQLLAEANNLASLGQYIQASESVKRAIKLKPKDAGLFKTLSEIYATDNRPQLALDAINRALALEPANIDYLRAKGTLAAWAGDSGQMEESYVRILLLKPQDQEALLNLAHALRWQGRTDDSIRAYKKLLKLYPKVAEGWIHYAEVLSWTENYISACAALAQYRSLKGITTEYLTKEARFLTLADRYKSALAINQRLLKKNPNDFYLLTTQVTALVKGFQINNALKYLQRINELYPDERQARSLNNMILTPLRTNVNLGGEYISASDTTRILSIPLTAQYFLTPTASLLFRGLYERAVATIDSGLETYNGKNSIFDESAMIGLSIQAQSLFNLSALVGGLKIHNENSHGIYEISLNPNVGEAVKLIFTSLHNLYRPYLVPQSPRSISLQIMETRNGINLEWQPFLQKYLNILVSHSDLSDTNSYWHYNIWPKARAYGSEHWKVTVGLNADIWQYKKRLGNGYYDPLDFKGYQGTIEAYYIQSENVGYSIWGGFGIQKDETFPRYYYGEDLGFQAFWGIYTDWQLRFKGGYTLRKNPDGKYDAWSTGLILTRRF
ncbi:tetratricopeptide repeat protein [Legionella israelensis]|uniref:Protein with TPR motifs (Protein-protein interaction motif) n=1 Tax=Legionella israelensis TaxID=454 RepID=A0A0W0WHQ8_9GAMM|nr:tetratricopeptide repeat protein [Legionella israelensis]KTD31822.1 protein with TPR motifs (protein-protein interaction motif) [Legionella israelensis]QBS10705.1 tetratricopeptide repeat protein [Legionella israelensis]SCY45789.1 Tetratricopeptide repeat-containing protein [Legionella israelensis DSM 19235]STX57666.1 protein with TPR motifs (protein-protein interaction motif) [Legionella israelensis]